MSVWSVILRGFDVEKFQVRGVELHWSPSYKTGTTQCKFPLGIQDILNCYLKVSWAHSWIDRLIKKKSDWLAQSFAYSFSTSLYQTINSRVGPNLNEVNFFISNYQFNGGTKSKWGKLGGYDIWIKFTTNGLNFIRWVCSTFFFFLPFLPFKENETQLAPFNSEYVWQFSLGSVCQQDSCGSYFSNIALDSRVEFHKLFCLIH